MINSDIQALCTDLVSRGFKSPLVAYKTQLYRAKQRALPFDLTFGQWWSIWAEKYHNRGHGMDRLCMGRKNDSGGYTYGNVYICTNSQNNSDSVKFAKSKVKVKDESLKLLAVIMDTEILGRVLSVLKINATAAVRYAIMQCDENYISTRSPTHQGGRKFQVENSKSYGLFLDSGLRDKAKKLGNGNISEGIRIAIKTLAQTL